MCTGGWADWRTRRGREPRWIEVESQAEMRAEERTRWGWGRSYVWEIRGMDEGGCLDEPVVILTMTSPSTAGSRR